MGGFGVYVLPNQPALNFPRHSGLFHCILLLTMLREIQYSEKALQEVSKWLLVLPSDVQRLVKLALSVIETHGAATSEELRIELGEKWVIARRTPSIIKKYGEDVKCYTQAQYEAAEIRAIEKRVTK